jgi:hypothetical protein
MVNLGDDRLSERFWSKVVPEPNSGCWLWIGSVGKNGYARFLADGRTRNAHRYAYSILVGEVASDLELDHLCRVRCCVNPAHLEAVTKAVNVARGLARPPTLRGESHPGVTVSDSDVAEARRLRADGWKLIDIAKRFGVGLSTASRWSRFAVRRADRSEAATKPAIDHDALNALMEAV